MPRIVVYDTDRKVTTNFTVAFARGVVNHNNNVIGAWEVKHMPIRNYLDNGLPQDLGTGDAVATLGILRGTGLMLKDAIQRGIDYYYMDHAYFNPGYNGKGWMRISKNGHSVPIFRQCEKDRWKGFHVNHGYNIENWLTNSQRGSTIIICPPTNAVSWFFGLEPNAWENDVYKQIKRIKRSDLTISVRRKPNEPIVDHQGFLTHLQENPQKGTLAEDLDNAHCVVAYNSMVALTATLRGIPVITSEHSCCNRVSYSIQDFATPGVFDIEPLNRRQLIYWLAYNQWRMRDIESGKAWGMLQENYLGF